MKPQPECLNHRSQGQSSGRFQHNSAGRVCLVENRFFKPSDIQTRGAMPFARASELEGHFGPTPSLLKVGNDKLDVLSFDQGFGLA